MWRSQGSEYQCMAKERTCSTQDMKEKCWALPLHDEGLKAVYLRQSDVHLCVPEMPCEVNSRYEGHLVRTHGHAINGVQKRMGIVIMLALCFSRLRTAGNRGYAQSVATSYFPWEELRRAIAGDMVVVLEMVSCAII
jgi:hypothetical protein